MITEAWPHLEGEKFEVLLPTGEIFEELGDEKSVLELVEDAPKEPCGVLPELKVEVKLAEIVIEEDCTECKPHCGECAAPDGQA